MESEYDQHTKGADPWDAYYESEKANSDAAKAFQSDVPATDRDYPALRHRYERLSRLTRAVLHPTLSPNYDTFLNELRSILDEDERRDPQEYGND